MKRTNTIRAVGVGLVCAAIGAAYGIAGSTAATSHKSTSRTANPPGARAGGRWGFRGPGGGPVHADAVVLNRAGTAFETVTQDNGAFKSLSGDQLTITEGTKTVTYKDVTLTIPSGATVYRNGAKAALTDLATGDRVHVSQAPEGTTVFAEDAAHQAAHAANGPDGGPGHPGPGFRGAFRGGPPGGPPGGGPPGPPPPPMG
jgi:hypothetical protein